jgi:hypothetical protein
MVSLFGNSGISWKIFDFTPPYVMTRPNTCYEQCSVLVNNLEEVDRISDGYCLRDNVADNVAIP